MGNILLPPQLINLPALTSQFPGPPFNVTKFVFQCELRDVTTAGDVVFGVIAYPLWKRGNSPREKWTIGKKVSGFTMPGLPQSFPIISANSNDPFTSFGNNEILIWHIQPDEKEQYGKVKQQNQKFVDLFTEVLKDKGLAEKSTISLKAYVSENPHISFDVTLSSPTGTESETADPCPPNQPGE
jgi:hypothetical protein